MQLQIKKVAAAAHLELARFFAENELEESTNKKPNLVWDFEK